MAEAIILILLINMGMLILAYIFKKIK